MYTYNISSVSTIYVAFKGRNYWKQPYEKQLKKQAENEKKNQQQKKINKQI